MARAGTINVNVAANTRGLENGLNRAKKSILGFSNWQKSIVKGVIGANIISGGVKGVISFYKGLINSNEEVIKMKSHFQGIGDAIKDFLISPIVRFAESVNRAYDKIKINEEKIFNDEKLKDYENRIKNIYLLSPEERRYKEDLEKLRLSSGETRRYLMNIMPTGGQRMTQEQKYLYTQAELQQLSREIQFAMQWSKKPIAIFDEFADKIKVINDWFDKNSIFHITRPELKTNNDPFGMMTFFKNYFLKEGTKIIDKSFQQKEIERSRLGVFQTGDEIWRQAMTAGLQGGRNDKLISNTERTAKATESLDRKWSGQPTQTAGLL